jgi:hypothetical protein
MASCKHFSSAARSIASAVPGRGIVFRTAELYAGARIEFHALQTLGPQQGEPLPIAPVEALFCVLIREGNQ